ncbi:HvAV3g_orf95-like-2 [Fopius arisanus]|uniref:MIMI_L206 protein n=1 Tax=Fopius arisanus TaxID=64838 RepID=A0A0C9QT08_9HYME|nr:HvAV3g_orf95-like-2 [Fopius arisanus]
MTGRETKRQLIAMCINILKPHLRRFCKSSSNGEFFICNAITGIWHKETKRIMENVLRLIIQFSTRNLMNEQLNEFLYLLLSKEWQKEVYEMLFELSKDEDIEEKFAVNENRFVVENGMIELGSKELQKANPEDYCLSGTGWCFREDLAQQYNTQVREFFVRLIPDSNELTILLTYFASLLYGKRADDKFIILRNKDNPVVAETINAKGSGKSTLIALIKIFFGKYMNQRMIAVDNVTPNNEKLLELTTKIGAIFGENRFTRLRIITEPEKERAVIVPMRSRFVSPAHVNAGHHIYEGKTINQETLQLWCSSILIFILNYRTDDYGLSLLPIPRSMRLTQCRSEDSQSENLVFNKWMEENLITTDNTADMVSLKDLYGQYRRNFQQSKRLPIRHFVVKAERFLRDKKISLTKRYRYTLDKKPYERRNVVHQVRIKESQ